jgi:hypothetical protein
MVENAVGHYFELVDQGVTPAAARLHVAQRFGIAPSVLSLRLAGFVVDGERTRELLAETREWLTDGVGASLRGAPEILTDLYEAITGEAPSGPGWAQDGQA